MSDVTTALATATTQPTRNTSQVTAVRHNGKRMTITRKCKAALDAMVWEGLTWDAAARKADFTVQAMRKALERPHVLAYLREQKQVFRAAASTANISALVKLRDDAGNAMAQLGAIKVLEQIEDSAAAHGRDASRAPGVTIVIAAPAGSLMQHQRPIDAKPLIDNVSVRMQRQALPNQGDADD